MRKLILSAVVFALSFGLALAGEVSFVKYNKETKELTVKENDKEATYKLTDETKVKRGDKEAPLEKTLKYFEEKTKEGAKFEITVDKDKRTISEIKLPGKKN